MTPKRAIEVIKDELPFESGVINEALELIEQALEYRTPKKPIHDGETGVYYCPSCQKSQAYAVDDFGDYCELCGQAIDKSLDWSDEE